jgi:predicted unusual protein kinase regulating ubiquinone biosynthesis (AarF/ABC1/UbiB family)
VASVLRRWVRVCVGGHGQLAKRGVAVRSLLEAGVRGSVAQLLTHGVMHADPHPGNLLLDHRGDLVYVDFGMVAEVAAADRVRLMRLLVAWVNVDATALALALRDASFLPRHVDLPAVVRPSPPACRVPLSAVNALNGCGCVRRRRRWKLS